MKKRLFKNLASVLISTMILCMASGCGKKQEVDQVSEEKSKEIEAAALYYSSTPSDALIYENVSIDGINVGGKTVEEAKKSLDEKTASYDAVKVILTSSYGDAETTTHDMGLAFNTSKSVEDAFGVGHSGSVLERYYEEKSLKDKPCEIITEKTIVKSNLEKVIKDQVNSKISSGKKANLIKNSDGTVKVLADSAGIVVDVDKTEENIVNAINLANQAGEIKVNIVINEGNLSEENKKLADIKDVLGTYQTYYGFSAEGRKANIAHACEFIDGTVLFPGDKMSYYNTIGPVELYNGYSMAPVILDGEHVDGVGGGICQPSSTLYNAILLAELEVLQREYHGLPVSYVPLSQDATIAGGYLDLIFRNNLDYPIYIEATADGEYCTFTIYGKETRPSNRTIKYEPTVLRTIAPGKDKIKPDSSVPEGKEEIDSNGASGYECELWKYVYVDGELIESTKVNYSLYDSEPRVILKNPKDIEKEKNGGKTETTTQATTQATTEAPTEAPTQAPTEAPTEPPTEPETEPETDPVDGE